MEMEKGYSLQLALLLKTWEICRDAWISTSESADWKRYQTAQQEVFKLIEEKGHICGAAMFEIGESFLQDRGGNFTGSHMAYDTVITRYILRDSSEWELTTTFNGKMPAYCRQTLKDYTLQRVVKGSPNEQ